MIPMLVMTGRVDNVFVTPEKEGKEGKYGGDHKVQLLVDQPQENGEIKRGLVDLKTKHPGYFQAVEGQRVSLPVGAYAYKGSVGYFILGSWSPPSAPDASGVSGTGSEGNLT